MISAIQWRGNGHRFIAPLRDSMAAEITRRHTAAQVVLFMLLEASEFLNKGHSDARFAEVCCRTFLNRAVDPEGKAFWLGRLRAGHNRRWVP